MDAAWTSIRESLAEQPFVKNGNVIDVLLQDDREDPTFGHVVTAYIIFKSQLKGRDDFADLFWEFQKRVSDHIFQMYDVTPVIFYKDDKTFLKNGLGY